jgi:hypothetical protein
MAYFSQLKNTLLTHHVYHANHHIFTTKTPQQKHDFLKKPQLNRPYTSARKKVYFGRYLAGIGLVGDSASQKMLTTQ